MVNILLIDQEPLFQQAFSRIISETEECQLIGIAENSKEAFEIASRYHDTEAVLTADKLDADNRSDIERLREHKDIVRSVRKRYRNGRVVKVAEIEVQRIAVYRIRNIYLRNIVRDKVKIDVENLFVGRIEKLNSTAERVVISEENEPVILRDRSLVIRHKCEC